MVEVMTSLSQLSLQEQEVLTTWARLQSDEHLAILHQQLVCAVAHYRYPFDDPWTFDVINARLEAVEMVMQQRGGHYICLLQPRPWHESFEDEDSWTLADFTMVPELEQQQICGLEHGEGAMPLDSLPTVSCDMVMQQEPTLISLHTFPSDVVMQQEPTMYDFRLDTDSGMDFMHDSFSVFDPYTQEPWMFPTSLGQETQFQDQPAAIQPTLITNVSTEWDVDSFLDDMLAASNHTATTPKELCNAKLTTEGHEVNALPDLSGQLPNRYNHRILRVIDKKHGRTKQPRWLIRGETQTIPEDILRTYHQGTWQKLGEKIERQKDRQGKRLQEKRQKQRRTRKK